MFIRSTGLGRTLLSGRIAAIQTTEMVPATLEAPAQGIEPRRMLMVMEIIHPVHWTVRAFVDPADLRQMAWMVVKNPMLIMRGIKFLFSKNPAYETPEATDAPIAGLTAQPVPMPSMTAAHIRTDGPGPIPAARPGPGPIPSRR